MANTVNINETQWDGYRGSIHYNLSSDSTAISDTVLVDISALAPAPTSVKIRSIQWTLHGNIILTLEFDATADEAWCRLENQTADTTIEGRRDFTDAPNGGWVPNTAAAGFTGDILLTSSGLAASDDFDLFIVFEKSAG